MPPRKSDTSKVATGDEGTATTTTTASKKEDGVSIEDLNLPKSIVTRLAKGVLPSNTQIQGNAMLALSKSATVFVSYLSTHANEYAQNANRKTIAPGDVFKALEDLEFDFKDNLEAELARFNEIQTEKRNTYRKKVAADKATGTKPDSPSDVGVRDGAAQSQDGEPAAKKARLDTDADVAERGNNDGEGDDTSDVPEEADEGEEDDEMEEEDEEAEDEDEGEGEEPPEETLEDGEEEEEEGGEGQDEALDNGEDSD